MSDVAQVALITGGIGLISLLATLWSNARRESRERQHRVAERREDHREWYSRTLFERRLQAAQQAYAWWTRLNVAVARARDNDDPNSAENQAVRQAAERAREWYEDNSFCLKHPGLSDMRPGLSEFVGLTGSALAWAGGQRDMHIHKELNEVYKWILKLESRLLEPERGEQVGARHGQ